MAQVSKYRYLLNQYPETVQKEQFRIICHISKRTARYLLQSGLVPCVQSGKKTRNYTIKMKDIVRYLERREIHPEKYKLPPGSYSGTYAVKPLLPESVTTEELRKYYIESFRDIPDIVSTREAAELTGATASTVAKWIRTKKLKALSHGPAFIIPKVNLIDFKIRVVHNIWKPSGCRITQWGQLGEILGGVRFPWAGSLPVTDDFPICAGCQGQMAHNKKTNRILYFAGNGAGLMACPVFRLT